MKTEANFFSHRQKNIIIILLSITVVFSVAGDILYKTRKALDPSSAEAYIDGYALVVAICRTARQQREKITADWEEAGVNVRETFSGGTATPLQDNISSWCDDNDIPN